MSSNEERKLEAAKTQNDSERSGAPKKQEKKEKPRFDTLSEDNPLICRGID